MYARNLNRLRAIAAGIKLMETTTSDLLVGGGAVEGGDGDVVETEIDA